MNNNIEQLIGLTIKSVDGGDSHIFFNCTNGKRYVMDHIQDCCESVTIDDITENWKETLTGATVLEAYESCNIDEPIEPIDDDDYYDESFTWTFYRIITNKGTVVIKWYGTSNGYYSESVDVREF